MNTQRPSGAVLALALTVIGASAVVSAPSSAQADQLGCGDTLTADTTLDSDVVNCSNNGLVIEADGITLDLNGHRIGGDGAEFAHCRKNEICDAGVVNDGHHRITIRNGSIRGFAVGVLISGASANEVRNVSSSRNDLFGAVIAESTKSAVRGGSFSNNVAPDGDGIGLFGSDRVQIVGSSVENNPGPGIHVAETTHSLVAGNHFARSSPGLLVEGDRNEVRGNDFARGGGITVGSGSRNRITRNRLSQAALGIAIEEGSHNVVARNLVIAPRSAGVRVGVDFADGSSVGGVDNVLRRNVVRQAGGDGFLINSKAMTILSHNIATGAGDDGFDVEAHATRLSANRAVGNGDLGIEATRGVVDGGQNVAVRNGDDRQCMHIVCR